MTRFNCLEKFLESTIRLNTAYTVYVLAPEFWNSGCSFATVTVKKQENTILAVLISGYGVTNKCGSLTVNKRCYNLSWMSSRSPLFGAKPFPACKKQAVNLGYRFVLAITAKIEDCMASHSFPNSSLFFASNES